MDQWGYTSALRMALELFERTQRGTGRTTAMLRGVNAGDVIIAGSHDEARQIEGALRRFVAPGTVSVIWSDNPGELEFRLRSIDRHRPDLQIHYSSEWTYKYLSAELSRMERDFAGFVAAIGHKTEPGKPPRLMNFRRAQEFGE